MRPPLPILALAALVLATSTAQASHETWRELQADLREETSEEQRVESTRDAWEDLGPRARMKAIELLSQGAGDTTERFLRVQLEKTPNAFLRRRLALVLGRFATRADTLETLERVAASDAVSQLDSGSCSRGKGHARAEARLAEARVRERRAQLLKLGDDSTISVTPEVGVSWFGTTTP